MILKLVGEIRKAFSPFDWPIFLVTYLLAIAAATLHRAVAIAAAIARATVVRLRLVAQALAGIATSELGPCFTDGQASEYILFKRLKISDHNLSSS